MPRQRLLPLVLTLGLALLVCLIRPASAQQCGWEAFGIDDLQPGVEGAVYTMAAFDDGSGPALYMGGRLVVMLPDRTILSGLVKLDKGVWRRVLPFDAHDIRAIIEFDDGNGPALYAPCSVGGQRRVYRITGQGAEPLPGVFNSAVHAFAVFDDGSGPALYAGGLFSAIDGAPMNGVARLTPTGWEPLGSGVASGAVNALTVYDDGSGPALIVGGAFTSAGGSALRGLAVWRNGTWGNLSPAITIGSGAVQALYADPTDGSLYVAGTFNAPSQSLAGFPRLASGAWTSPASPFTGSVSAVQRFTHPKLGSALYILGRFTSVAGTEAFDIAKFDGTSWSALGAGLVGLGSLQLGNACLFHDARLGPDLFVGGGFCVAGGVQSTGIARWDGDGFSAFPNGQRAYINCVAALGEGPSRALYVAGLFQTIIDLCAIKDIRADLPMMVG